MASLTRRQARAVTHRGPRRRGEGRRDAQQPVPVVAFVLRVRGRRGRSGSPSDGAVTPSQVPDQPVEVLTEDQARTLLDDCKDRAFVAVRDTAIIRVLIGTCIRRALLGMTVEDVDLDQDVVYVLGKGRRERACPFGRKTAMALDRATCGSAPSSITLDSWTRCGCQRTASQRLGTRDDAASPRPARRDRLHPSAPAPPPGRALGRIRLELRPGALRASVPCPGTGMGWPAVRQDRSRRFADHADTTVIVELEPAVAPKGSRCWLAMSARTSITGPPRRLPPITGNRRLRPVHASTHRALNAPTPRCSAAARPSAFTRRVSMGGSTIDRSRVAVVASRPPYNPTSSYQVSANGQAACSHSATVVRSTASSSARSARTHERTCASWAPPSSG